MHMAMARMKVHLEFVSECIGWIGERGDVPYGESQKQTAGAAIDEAFPDLDI